MRVAGLWASLGMASVLLLTAALSRRTPMLLDVGSAGDQRFLSGFLPAIIGEKTAYRWSGPDALVHLHGFTCEACVVTLRVDAGAGSPPRRLRLVRLEGPRGPETELASVVVTPGWQTHRIDLPQAELRPTALSAPPLLGIRADVYRLDADRNELGFKIDELRVEALSRRLSDGLVRALLLSTGLGLVALLLRRVLRQCAPRRLGGHATRLSVLFFVTAVAVLATALRASPFTSAWALPAMPVTAGLLAGVAVVPALVRTLTAARNAIDGASLHRTLRWAGLVLAVLGLGLLYIRDGALVGGLLSLAGLVLVAMTTRTSPEGAPHASSAKGAAFLAACAAILLVGLALRFYRIESLPYGLWRDEARHGLAALRIIEDPGYRPVFVPAADIPAAGLYAFVPGILAFGIAPWTLRVTTTLAGFLTLIPFALLARWLTRRTDTALVATGLLAASAWHLNVGRLGFTVVFEPLCEITTLVLLARGLNASTGAVRRALWLGLAGLCLALTLQTYHSGRMAVVLAAAFVLLFRERNDRGRNALLRLAPAVAVFVLAMTPLAVYAWSHAREVNARVGQAFLVSHALTNGEAPLAALDDSLGRHLLMLHARGDTAGRHNLPGQPQLEPLAGLGFLLGVAALLRRRREPAMRFLLLACAVTVIPSLMSVDGPRATRAVSLLPYAIIVAAVGWETLIASVARRVWIPVALTVASAAFSFWSYFVAAPRDEAVWRSFSPIETQIGVYLRSVARQQGPTGTDHVYLPQEMAGHEIVRYLGHGLPFGVYGPLEMWPAPNGAVHLLVPEGRGLDTLSALSTHYGRRVRGTQPGSTLPDGNPAFTIVDVE
jgi:hypothetical protein